MTTVTKSPAYMNGDRQQNSHVLAGEVTKHLLNGDYKSEAAKLLKSLLVRYYSWFACGDLDKQIEHFELYKQGRVKGPVDLTKWY